MYSLMWPMVKAFVMTPTDDHEKSEEGNDVDTLKRRIMEAIVGRIKMTMRDLRKINILLK